MMHDICNREIKIFFYKQAHIFYTSVSAVVISGTYGCLLLYQIPAITRITSRSTAPTPPPMPPPRMAPRWEDVECGGGGWWVVG